jgi:hypothetical protein
MSTGRRCSQGCPMPLAEAGSEIVQFSPAQELQAVSAVMMKNAQRMMQSA